MTSKLIFSILMLNALMFQNVFSQDSIRTEVFTLSTCDPNSNSLIKELGGNYSKKEYVFKLESRSNKPSVLQITGINPLRYKYYINNEAVTQFMESSPLALSINSFVNGDYLISAPEIKVPEIFRVDSISPKVKAKIRDYQSRIKELEDSIDQTNTKIRERWEELSADIRNINDKSDSIKLAKRYNNDIVYRRLYNLLDKYRILYDRNLKEYQIYTSGLPINNPKFGILEQYRNLTFSYNEGENELDTIRAFQKDFANQYLDHHLRLKRIDSILRVLSGDPFYNNYRTSDRTSAESLLVRDLLFYNFDWSNSNSYFSPSGRDNFQDNINDVKQQILNKRFQLYEEFVLNLATKIGVLVQNHFREYSSFNNALENFPCIDNDLIFEIYSKREKLIKSFEFIQRTSAELQIMVSYLDINTDLYQSIVKKINNNYVFLLSYLKNLDYVIQVNNKSNTRLNTLPTSTNLKNIDIIRYTVKREDKITKTTQTYNYDFWMKGGLKIDFSVGFFGTRLIDNVYNKVLLDTAGGIDNIRITKQDNGQADFAFGGMVNVTRRNGASWINLGGSIGVAYSGNQKLQVLTGLSLHLGKTERLIVHGGFGFGTIKYIDISANDFKFFDKELKSVAREKLSDVNENDRVYMLQSPDIKFSSFTIPTFEKFVTRPFIGISYNLSKKNALQAVSGVGVKTYSDNFNSAISN